MSICRGNPSFDELLQIFRYRVPGKENSIVCRHSLGGMAKFVKNAGLGHQGVQSIAKQGFVSGKEGQGAIITLVLFGKGSVADQRFAGRRFPLMAKSKYVLAASVFFMLAEPMAACRAASALAGSRVSVALA